MANPLSGRWPRSRRQRWLLAALVVVGPLLNTTHSDAHPGDLDADFDDDGRVVTDFGSGHASVASVAVQADGRIVVAGVSGSDFAVARYNADGSPDTTFDSDGKLTTDFSGLDDQAADVAVQGDGKIVVTGYSTVRTGNENFALARYNADGSLDTTFDGDGKLTTDFAGNTDKAMGMAVQADGKIVAGGHATVISSGPTVVANFDFALVRYNADGSLDATYDGDGKVTTDFGGPSEDLALDVALTGDGQIVAAGYRDTPGGRDFALARYDAGGSLDASFDGDGRVFTDFGGPGSQESAFAVAVQADQKIVAAGQSPERAGDFALARYHPSGVLDATFDDDGKVTTDIGVPDDQPSFITGDTATDLAIQPDGTILASGARTRIAGDADFALVRYYPDGSLDDRFDVDGKATTDFGTGSHDAASAMEVHGDGLILGGYAAGSTGNRDFALARYFAGPEMIFPPDFDEDLDTDMAVWRPRDGTWYVRQSSGNWNSFLVRQWGINGDIPLVNTDFDGDHKADMAVWRPRDGTWYVRQSTGNWNSFLVRQWGISGDIPLVNTDFDGDANADMALWRPRDGTWWALLSSTGFEEFIAAQWGVNGDIPLANTDFDGDGKADMAVWRPRDGTWYVRQSTGNWNSFLVRQWGINGDIPVVGGP